MRRASFADMNCPIARTLEIIGEWWTPLILRDALFGVTRFDEFQSRLGIARNILAARLDTLVEAGVMERRTYDEARDRADYVLTDMGRALWPVLAAMRLWGDEWLLGEGHEPVLMEHTTCGAIATAAMTCSHCGEPLRTGEVRAVPGPGMRDPSFLQPVQRSASVAPSATVTPAPPRGAADGPSRGTRRRAPTRRGPR